MSIKTYQGILNGNPVNINLYRGDNGVAVTSPYDSYIFASAADIEYALNGIFDPAVTYITHRSADTEFLRAKGFSNPLTISNGSKIIFPSGRQILFTLEADNYTYSFRFTYSYGDHYLSYIVRGEGKDGNNAPTHTTTDKQYHYAVGLISDKILSYISTSGNEINPPIVDSSVDALMYPAITMRNNALYPGLRSDDEIQSYSIASPGNAGMISGYKKTVSSYPALINYATTGDRDYFLQYPTTWSSSTKNGVTTRQTTGNEEYFQRAVNFFTEFWSGIDLQYSATVTQSVGGTVSPTGFFGKPAEPKMFIVTPDTHHAIHSVSAYNTEINAQIPLQESAMNLQTGAKSYIFNMPSANVRIIVEFRSIEVAIPVTVRYAHTNGRVYTTGVLYFLRSFLDGVSRRYLRRDTPYFLRFSGL